MTQFVLQDPDETLVHAMDWTDWLGGDTIAGTASAISPSAGVTLADLGVSGAASSARVSGLTRGQIYRLTLQVTTTTGAEIGERSIIIRCDHQ